MRGILYTLAVTLVVTVTPASAHHSFATYYIESESMVIEGRVEEFQLRSPHAMLLVTARTPDGQTATYSAEWGNPRRMGRDGITKDTLKPGDLVVVTGSPGRTRSEFKMHLKGIRRPADGWSWGGGRRR